MPFLTLSLKHITNSYTQVDSRSVNILALSTYGKHITGVTGAKKVTNETPSPTLGSARATCQYNEVDVGSIFPSFTTHIEKKNIKVTSAKT